jgi:hypothetical protein
MINKSGKVSGLAGWGGGLGRLLFGKGYTIAPKMHSSHDGNKPNSRV